MYKLLFSDGQFIELPDIKSMRIGLAKWDGKGVPKYLWIWIKERYISKENKQKWETLFYYGTLKLICIYSEDGKTLQSTIQVPTPQVDFHYEEGDIVAEYGDQLYADEAY